MSETAFELTFSPPSASDFAHLRNTVDWQNPPLPIVQNSINASLFWVTAYLEGELVGCGRVIGDGAMYFYIQDVIVHPDHQSLGLGDQIMQAINQYLGENCQSGSTVGLLSAKGKEAFYRKHGFVPRNGANLGLGMCRFV